MYTLIRLKEGVKTHSMAGRTAKATAPHLGKPGTAKTMAPGFSRESAGYADFSRAPWTQLLVG